MELKEYSGFPFPALVEGPNGPLAYVTENTPELIKSSVAIILLTPKGSRDREPEFGCDIHRFLFEPANQGDFETMVSLVHEALSRWEPRIAITPEDITVEPSYLSDAGILVSVNYRILTATTANALDSVSITL